MSSLTDLLSSAVGIADQYVTNGVTVSIKTAYGPPLAVYHGGLSGASSAGAGGAQASSSSGILKSIVGPAAIIVTDDTGRTIATYGTPPATSYIRIGIALALAGLVLAVFIRGLKP